MLTGGGTEYLLVGLCAGCGGLDLSVQNAENHEKVSVEIELDFPKELQQGFAGVGVIARQTGRFTLAVHVRGCSIPVRCSYGVRIYMAPEA